MEGRISEKEAIDIHKLAETLEMSRTPIHKALGQLEQEGYITITPQVGVFVKRPSHRDVYERLLVCATLDILMAGQAAININDEQLLKLFNIIKKMDDKSISGLEFDDLNMEFHTLMYKASNIDYAFQMNKTNWDYLNYIRISKEIFNEESRQQSQTEHWMLYYALKDHDQSLVEKIMEKHLHRALSFISGKYKTFV